METFHCEFLTAILQESPELIWSTKPPSHREIVLFNRIVWSGPYPHRPYADLPSASYLHRISSKRLRSWLSIARIFITLSLYWGVS